MLKKKNYNSYSDAWYASVYEFSDYTAFIENGSISWYGKSKEIKEKVISLY